jgi:hypothetical protein
MPEYDALNPEQDPEVEATETELDAELDAFTSQAVAGVDPNAYITIRTSGGDSRYVPVSETGTMTAGDALMASNLAVSGAFQIFMDGVKIGFDTVVPAGKELTVLGNVKGG